MVGVANTEVDTSSGERPRSQKPLQLLQGTSVVVLAITGDA